MTDPATVALAMAAFLIGGFVKGTIGLGLPVVVLSALALVMPLRDAMAVFLIPGLVSNLWQATHGPYLPGLVRRLWPKLVGAVFGIVLGVWLTAGTKSEDMAVVLGILLCLYSAYALLTPRLPPPGRHEVWLSPLAGGTGGLFVGMAGIYIVPGLLYMETLRLPRDEFVQALGLTFVVLIVTLGATMASFSLMTWSHAGFSLVGLLPVFAGLWAGRRIRHRISEAFYRHLFFIALFITGIYMIVRMLG